jgi:hypothetical protein
VAKEEVKVIKKEKVVKRVEKRIGPTNNDVTLSL